MFARIFGVLLTPVPPEITDVQQTLTDLGMWPYVTTALIIGLAVLLWQRTKRG